MKTKLIMCLTLLGVTAAEGADLKFFQIEDCKKSSICLVGNLEEKKPITLLNFSSSKSCVASAGISFTNAAGEPNSVTAIAKPQCSDFASYSQALEGKHSDIVFGTERTIPIAKLDELDKLIRKSKVWSPKTKLVVGKMLGDVELTVDSGSEVRIKNESIYVVRYKSSQLQGYFYAFQVLVKGRNVFEIPTKGVTDKGEIFSFYVAGRTYLHAAAACDACDSWTGSEIFDVSNEGVKKVFIEYDKK